MEPVGGTSRENWSRMRRTDDGDTNVQESYQQLKQAQLTIAEI
jgi:hypothetical protein